MSEHEELIERLARELSGEYSHINWDTASDAIQKGVRQYVKSCILPLISAPTAAGEPEREALVSLLASNVNGECGMAWYPSGKPTDRAFIYADAILAAGYRREPEPRVVTTVEELDALPLATVVQSEVGGIWEKWGKSAWYETGSAQRHLSKDLELPATVLFAPEVTP